MARTVVGTRPQGAVVPVPAQLADTVVVHTAAMAVATVGARPKRTIFATKAECAVTRPVVAVAVRGAVIWAPQETAVVACVVRVAFTAHQLPVACPVIGALVRTGSNSTIATVKPRLAMADTVDTNTPVSALIGAIACAAIFARPPIEALADGIFTQAIAATIARTSIHCVLLRVGKDRADHKCYR